MTALFSIIVLYLVKPISSAEQFGVMVLFQASISFLSIIGDFGTGNYLIHSRVMGPSLIRLQRISFLLSMAVAFLGSCFIYFSWNVNKLDIIFVCGCCFFSAQQKFIRSKLLILKKFYLISFGDIVARGIGILAILGLINFVDHENIFTIFVFTYFLVAFSNWLVFCFSQRSGRWSQDGRAIKSLRDFLPYQVGTSILSFFSQNADLLAIGILYGPAGAGVFGLLKSIFFKVSNLYAQGINRYFIPNYTADDTRSHFIWNLLVMLLIGVLISLFLFISIEYFEFFFDLADDDYYQQELAIFLIGYSFARSIQTASAGLFIYKGAAKAGLFFSCAHTLCLLFLAILAVGFGMDMVGFVQALLMFQICFSVAIISYCFKKLVYQT